MASPQYGIFALGTRSHYYLELDLLPGAEPAEMVAALSLVHQARCTTGGANLVAGVAPSIWRSLAPEECPADSADFTSVRGPNGYAMPATQHAAWVWVAGDGYDTVFDVARATEHSLAGCAKVAEQTPGFTYLDSRDLTGFVDGTANPGLDEAPKVCVVPEGSPAAGSSIVLVQRWVHDLAGFESLSLADQEAVFGRTKAASIELGTDEKPDDAHIARVEIDDASGGELAIFRRSASFGDVITHGLMFVGFTNRQLTVSRMLERMAGGADGKRDRLTYFSTPVTGAFYVVPSVEALTRFKP